MTRHERLIARAREVWQGAAPSEEEILRGAERVGRRLTARAKPFSRRPIMVALGACAAFLAALAYAGNQKWIESPRLRHVDPQSTSASSALEIVSPTPAPTNNVPPSDPPAVPTSPAIAEATKSPLDPGSPGASGSPARSTERREAAGGGDVAKAPKEPSWAEVSEALSGGDEKHAQTLLSDLARQGQNADDRAKAKLGLAQLEASHGNCAKARVLAMQVAAVQGIELKTVRRALELAEHCTQ